MASEPYERPRPPTPARALNHRILLSDVPPEVGTGLHLTISEDGDRYWGPPPVSGLSAPLPIHLSWDDPDSLVPTARVSTDWSVGLTEDQMRTLMALGAPPDKLAFLASGYREMNAAETTAPGTLRTPRYVHPTDAANPDAGGFITETRPVTMTREEKKQRRYLPTPLDAVNDMLPSTPVAFTEVDALSLRTIPAVVRKRVRGARGSRGEVKDFRGRPLDS